MPHVDELVHDQHDPILMVSLASGDLAATDRDYATAQSLIASCTGCARLHDDVLAIARATKALPPAVRDSDFRLTDADAAKLRPAGWRRLLGGFANGPLFSRQLGVGLATLGIAGLLLTALPGIPLASMGGAAASSPAAAAEALPHEPPESGSDAAMQAPAPSMAAASAAPGAIDVSGGIEPRSTSYQAFSSATQAPAGLSDGTRAVGVGASRQPTVNATPNNDQPLAASAPTDQSSTGGPSTMAIVSAVLLGAGLLLLLARRFARGTTSA